MKKTILLAMFSLTPFLHSFAQESDKQESKSNTVLFEERGNSLIERTFYDIGAIPGLEFQCITIKNVQDGEMVGALRVITHYYNNVLKDTEEFIGTIDSDEMDAAMKSNVGFASRFNWTIEFEDYAPKEMYNILIKLCKKQKFVFEEDPEVVRTAITDRLAELKSARGKYFGNARDVRMLFEKMMARQNIRLGQLSVRELNDKNVLSTLKICDLPTVEELVQSLTDNQL